MFHHTTILKMDRADSPNYSYNQGFLLANYLAGKNASGDAVSWPAFQGSSTQGFAGKYTSRQLDSIVAQILSVGSKGISSDYPYTSGNVGEQIGHRYMVAPYAFPGWLSRQWVIGVGRSPKVTQLYMRIEAQPSEPPGATWSPSNPNYSPPVAMMDIWLEWWLPVGYLGGPKVLDYQASEFIVGQREAVALNAMDFPRSIGDTNVPNYRAAPLPRDPLVPTYSFWADRMLRNNQGIDFAGNPGVLGTNINLDPDQVSAQAFHDPFSRIDPASQALGNYEGTSGGDVYNHYASPFFLAKLEKGGPAPGGENPQEEWQPGDMRSIRSLLGPSYRMKMQTNANNTTLEISGGLAVKSQLKAGHFSDSDPVPLEAMRGATEKFGVATQEPYVPQDGDKSEAEQNNAWATVPAVPPSLGTLHQRVLASVIPVNASLQVSGQVRHVMMNLKGPRRDPLVNKFPGDWESTTSTASSTTISPPADFGAYEKYPDTALRAALTDPDSYWMPTADAGLCDSIDDVADQTQIPRSARMPNIGYLQYVRTGIIPDDESGDYGLQHGTPFRLLSFAPSYEDQDASDPLIGQQTTRSGSQSYPDWAMLDLFYIPSTLAPFGSTYHPATGNPSTNTAVTNLLYFGTFGGATAGKINPNGAVIYTTNANVAQANVSRTLPLQALVNGVIVNQTLTGSGTNATFNNGSIAPATSIAQAIESYIRANQPLRMPAEICNVPDIAVLRAPNNPTRNDLVRQVVGALTTQGNVFAVWTVGQAVQKKPGNPDFGAFELGDNVLAEVRLRLIVERYLDPGADGVYGNSGAPGPDGIAGTYDDPADANHPFQPAYQYRVIASEEIR